MNGESSHGKPFYRCGASKDRLRFPIPRTPYRDAVSLESVAWGEIEALLRDPATLNAAIEEHCASLALDHDTAASEASQARAQLAKVKRQRELLYSDRLDETISKEMFKAKDAQLEASESHLTGGGCPARC